MIPSRTFNSSKTQVSAYQALLDAIPWRAAVLDHAGRITAVNGGWHINPADAEEDYSSVLQRVAGVGKADVQALREGIEAIGTGEKDHISIDCEGHDATGSRWWRMQAKRMEGNDAAVLVILEDITDWKSVEAKLEQGMQAREEELRRRQELQQQLVDYLPDGVIYLASDGSLMGVNRQGALSLHMSVDELKKMKLSDFAGLVTHEDGRPCPVEDYPASRCLATGEPQPPKMIGVAQKDGSMQWLLVTAVPAPCPRHAGRTGALATFLDLTERKKIEVALQQARLELETRVRERTAELQQANDRLRESEARFRQMAENIGEVIYILQLNPTRLLYISPTYEKVYGIPAAEMYANWHSFTRVVEPEDLPRVLESLETRFHEPVDTVYRIRHVEGGIRWLRSRAFPIRDASGEVFRVTGIVEDITDIQRAQEELSRLQQEVLAVTERERRRIGQDLHDGLGQHLTGIAFLSKSLQQRVANKAAAAEPVTEREASEVATISELVQSAIAQSRALARGLQPVEQAPTGLMSALQELAARAEAVFDIKCTFECESAVLVEDDASANNLYRIAQESVNNAVKHAKARRVRIELAQAGNQITLLVADDGTGLPPVEQRGTGMGLSIMSFRAKSIGGSLSICRGDNGGTIVKCVLPTNAERTTHER